MDRGEEQFLNRSIKIQEQFLHRQGMVPLHILKVEEQFLHRPIKIYIHRSPPRTVSPQRWNGSSAILNEGTVSLSSLESLGFHPHVLPGPRCRPKVVFFWAKFPLKQMIKSWIWEVLGFISPVGNSHKEYSFTTDVRGLL